MKSFFAAIGRFFKRLFSNGFVQRLDMLVDQALPIVTMIAAATPTRTDDEVLAVYKALKAEGIWDASKPVDVLLRDLAVFLLGKKAPDGIATRVLIMAVEIAYNAFRENQTEPERA